MANRRAEGQVLVGFWTDEKFAGLIRDAIKAIPAKIRPGKSQWLRNSIAEHLRANGYQVEDEVTVAPDRLGKGGRRRKIIYPEHRPGGFQLNEKSTPNSSAEKGIPHTLDGAALSTLKKRQRRGPSSSSK